MLGREAARAGGVEQSPTTWFALTELHEQPLRLGELARRIGISQSAASALLRKLETEGRIVTAADAADGRAKLLTLTDVGRTELGQWRSLTARRLAASLADLEAADDAALWRVWEIINARRGQMEKREYRAAVPP